MHLHLENPLHRFLNFGLSRRGRYLKNQCVLVLLDRETFLGITGRRRIWYADFIRPPPPLFHVASGAAENAKLSSAPRLRLPPVYVAVSKSNSSAKSAASRSPAAKRLPGRSAAGDKDAPRCRSPTRRHEDFANSRPDCDFHAWKPRPAAPCYRL